MEFRILNPAESPDWDEVLLQNNDHSFFHTSAWAKVLQATYRFKPLYFVSSESGRLALLMPMMEVYGPLKGKRGVALPFTDRCAPHVLEPESLKAAVKSAIDYGEKNGWRSIEWRDDPYGPEGAPAWKTYLMHEIGLRKTKADLFKSLSSNNRRNIKKALREGVSVRTDRSAESLRSFYRLNCMTRKRHALPPQPFIFFKNVLEHVLSRDLGQVFSAYHAGKVIAASIFFHFGNEALFKYGASEMEHQCLRPNNLLMWEALNWYNDRNFATMSLGRTEIDNRGLLRYKRAWGAKETVLEYFRYDLGEKAYLAEHRGRGGLSRFLVARTPTSILRIIGRLFYRLVG
ncbi:MAG: GNAT family N-acetyltransferase [Candidatus Aminicenantales bacterium]